MGILFEGRQSQGLLHTTVQNLTFLTAPYLLRWGFPTGIPWIFADSFSVSSMKHLEGFLKNSKLCSNTFTKFSQGPYPEAPSPAQPTRCFSDAQK